MYKKIIKYIWISGLSFFLFIFILVLGARINLFGLFGEIPSFEILENPQKDLATTIYTQDGVLMGKYFDQENRVDVPYRDISKHAIKALIATEDERYEEHSGIDLRALARVVKGILLGRHLGGGSTITQQVAKNLFEMRTEPQYQGYLYKFSKTKSLCIKVKEWITAVRLERAYTKREIITMYFNTVKFGSKVDGIHTAAKTFFNKHPQDLKIEEASILVGLLRATTFYNPRRNKENALRRRNVVMSQMKKNAFLTENAYDSLRFLPIVLDYNPESYNNGIAPYFRAVIKPQIQEWCKKNNYDIFKSGLKVYTSIESKIQNYAEQAVTTHMSELQKKLEKEWNNKFPFDKEYLTKELKKTPYYKELKRKYKIDSINYYLSKKRNTELFTWAGTKQMKVSFVEEFKHQRKFLTTGLVSINPYTREVKAWVGGINHEYFPLDHVQKTKRQPGSTFKPIVYSTAINSGYTPCTTFPDVPMTIKASDGVYWEPKGAKHTGEYVSLREALARSMNNISAKLMQKVGPENAVAHAHQLGVKSDLNPVLSLVLGTSSVNVLEMTNSYCTFVNHGTYKDPILIKKITDKHGRVLAEFTNEISSNEVMSQENAYKVVSMLRGSTFITKGTARRLDTEYNLLENNEIGGKTGTTQHSTDGWFMGITKDLVTGCWVGGEDNSVRFNSGYYGQGSRMAMPIFAELMSALYRDASTGIHRGPFPLPANIDDAFIKSINCEPAQKSTGQDKHDNTEFDTPDM